MRRAFALVLALAATPVSALEIAPQCTYVTATGKLVSWQDSADGEGVYVERAGNGIAGWTVYDSAREYMALAVLQHCASGRELAVVLPRTGNEAAFGRWSALVWGDGRFTMQQVAREMERLGGKAHFRNDLAHGTCACDEMATW